MTGPALKKTARRKAWLVYIDESGLLMAPLVRRTWGQRGQTPVFMQRARFHKKVSAIAALCVSPDKESVRLYFRLHPGDSINADLVLSFLSPSQPPVAGCYGLLYLVRWGKSGLSDRL